MRKVRRGKQDANVSFLDIICCGFGAIILLLVIVKPAQRVVLEESHVSEKGQVKALQTRLFKIRGEVSYLEKELNAKQEQLDNSKQRVAILQSKLETLFQKKQSLQANAGEENEVLELKVALQSLTQEMRRLLKGRKKQNQYIGGIPVDSEYIIFIIDTSGSMYSVAWNRVLKEVNNILDIYPNVKGIQVMNDQGKYMFSNYRGQWIPDTPARRAAIMQNLKNWNAYSNSSPEQGIVTAIRQYYDKNKKISLYVFGDDFARGSVRKVLKSVQLFNSKLKNGQTLVRIHAVGFPVSFLSNVVQSSSAVKYANLMRELAEHNSGSFIGLNDVR